MTTDLQAPTQKLMTLFRIRSGTSHVAGQVLRTIHSGHGEIEWQGLTRLDGDNRAAALALIEAGLGGRELPLSKANREELWEGVEA